MSSAVLNRWTWIIILSIILVVIIPLTLIWLILGLPPIFRLIATVVIFILWGIVSGYKDWVISKHQQEEEKTSRT